MDLELIMLVFVPQAVAQAMQGVEILVAVVASHQLNWIYWEVFECMIEDNLMETCTVVLKLLEKPSLDKDRGFITVGNALQNCGLIGDKWRGNACEQQFHRIIISSNIRSAFLRKIFIGFNYYCR